MHVYDRPGVYTAGLKVTDREGLSDTDQVTVTVRGADLRITSITTSSPNPKEGDRVTLTATVGNSGAADAAASKTAFALDGSTMIATVDTRAIPTGGSATVSTLWSTKKVKGQHVITATADSAGAVGETNEANNASTLAVTVKGNKVTNGSFEEPNASGNGAADWSSSGSTSYGDNGTDGSKAATTNGGGLTPATFTSAPFAVAPGETLDVAAAVRASGAATAPTVGLAFLSPLGSVVATTNALAAPLTTSGFATLAKTVTVPMGVASVQVVLTGSRSGTVTFDDVGVFAQ